MRDRRRSQGSLGDRYWTVYVFSLLLSPSSLYYYFFFCNESHFANDQKNSHLLSVFPLQHIRSVLQNIFKKGSFRRWTANLCSHNSVEIHDLYSPSSSPSPSHQFEFALHVKSHEKLFMTEGSSELESQRQMLFSARESWMWVWGKRDLFGAGCRAVSSCAGGGIWARICTLRVVE